MSKKSIICTVLFVMMFSFTIIGTSKAVHNVGPADMVLETDKHKKPAQFAHKKHQDMMKCGECHHSQTADGKQGPYVAGEEKKCATCHNSKMPNKKLNNFMKAGHAKCKGCHKKGYDGKKGPTKCNGCHTKK